MPGILKMIADIPIRSPYVYILVVFSAFTISAALYQFSEHFNFVSFFIVSSVFVWGRLSVCKCFNLNRFSLYLDMLLMLISLFCVLYSLGAGESAFLLGVCQLFIISLYLIASMIMAFELSSKIKMNFGSKSPSVIDLIVAVNFIIVGIFNIRTFCDDGSRI